MESNKLLTYELELNNIVKECEVNFNRKYALGGFLHGTIWSFIWHIVVFRKTHIP